MRIFHLRMRLRRRPGGRRAGIAVARGAGDAGCRRADFRRLPEADVIAAPHERFREAAANCDWTLVIAPEFDDHLLTLSQTVLDVGGRLLGSMPDAIRLTGDKLATAKFWHRTASGIRHRIA